MDISVPSYVIPGTYLENLQFLDSKPDIQGVELLFFLYDQETEQLFFHELPYIREFGSRFFFSVHMPDLLTPAHSRILDRTKILADSYVVHEPPSDSDSFFEIVGRWRERHGDIFFLENLIGRDFHSAADAAPDMPICFDTGHVLCRGESPAQFADRYGHRIREVHLHGVEGDQDHRPFTGDAPWFSDLLPFLRDFTGKLNIELFAFDQVKKILEVMASCFL